MKEACRAWRGGVGAWRWAYHDGLLEAKQRLGERQRHVRKQVVALPDRQILG